MWSVRIEAVFAGGDRRLSSRREIRDDSGRLLRVENRELNYTGGSGRITITDAGTGRAEVRQVSVGATSVGVEMLAAYLRLLPWVKYQGPDEGRLSREIVQELVRFEARPSGAP